jgi:hypothetical protein
MTTSCYGKGGFENSFYSHYFQLTFLIRSGTLAATSPVLRTFSGHTGRSLRPAWTRLFPGVTMQECLKVLAPLHHVELFAIRPY